MTSAALPSTGAPVEYRAIHGTFQTLRALTAGSSAAVVALFATTWDRRMALVIAALSGVWLVDALNHRRRPDSSPTLRLVLDASLVSAAVVVLRGPALIAAPYAYLLTATLLLLPLRRVFAVTAYLTAVVVAVFVATSRLDNITSDWHLILLAILVFTAALSIFLAAVLRALQPDELGRCRFCLSHTTADEPDQGTDASADASTALHQRAQADLAGGRPPMSPGLGASREEDWDRRQAFLRSLSGVCQANAQSHLGELFVPIGQASPR